jgi:hypothetical protein
MSWRVLAKEGGDKVVISCPEGRFSFVVFHGNIKRPMWFCLKAIETPVLRRRIPEGFKVRCPMKLRGRGNVGEQRKSLILCPPKSAPLELRLIAGETRLNERFLNSLRDVLERRVDPGTTNQSLSEGASGSDGWGAIRKEASP